MTMGERTPVTTVPTCFTVMRFAPPAVEGDPSPLPGVASPKRDTAAAVGDMFPF